MLSRRARSGFSGTRQRGSGGDAHADRRAKPFSFGARIPERASHLWTRELALETLATELPNAVLIKPKSAGGRAFLVFTCP